VLGDKTSHGGVVIGSSQTSDTHGKRLARVGDKVTCPKKGHGTTIIVTGDPTMIVDGAPVARHGDRCACGAVLISSQMLSGVKEGAQHSPASKSPPTGQTSAAAAHLAAAAISTRYDQSFALTCDLTGMPLAKQPYRLRYGALVIEGITDEHGQTRAIPTGEVVGEVICEVLGEDIDG